MADKKHKGKQNDMKKQKLLFLLDIGAYPWYFTGTSTKKGGGCFLDFQNNSGLLIVILVVLICIPVVIWASRKSKRDMARSNQEIKRLFLAEPRDIILSSLRAMDEGMGAGKYAEQIKAEAARIADDNLFEPVLAIEELASEVRHIVYCRGALARIIGNLEGDSFFRLEDFDFGGEEVTIPKLRAAQAWLDANFAYEPADRTEDTAEEGGIP